MLGRLTPDQRTMFTTGRYGPSPCIRLSTSCEYWQYCCCLLQPSVSPIAILWLPTFELVCTSYGLTFTPGWDGWVGVVCHPRRVSLAFTPGYWLVSCQGDRSVWPLLPSLSHMSGDIPLETWNMVCILQSACVCVCMHVLVRMVGVVCCELWVVYCSGVSHEHAFLPGWRVWWLSLPPDTVPLPLRWALPQPFPPSAYVCVRVRVHVCEWVVLSVMLQRIWLGTIQIS